METLLFANGFEMALATPGDGARALPSAHLLPQDESADISAAGPQHPLPAQSCDSVRDVRGDRVWKSPPGGVDLQGHLW